MAAHFEYFHQRNISLDDSRIIVPHSLKEMAFQMDDDEFSDFMLTVFAAMNTRITKV